MNERHTSTKEKRREKTQYEMSKRVIGCEVNQEIKTTKKQRNKRGPQEDDLAPNEPTKTTDFP